MIFVSPPRLGHFSIGWIAIAVALITPWAWLVVLDRRLRGDRRPTSSQAR